MTDFTCLEAVHTEPTTNAAPVQAIHGLATITKSPSSELNQGDSQFKAHLSHAQNASQKSDFVIELELPYPPSLNHYWRRVGARTLISRKGRAFRQSVCNMLLAYRVQPLDGPLELVIYLFPPDRRRRDVDNSQKALLDALAHGGAFRDDSQIIHLDVWKLEPVPGGKTLVKISRYTEP